MKTSGWIAIGLLAIVGVVLAGAGFVSAQTAADADFDGSGDVGFQDFLLFAAKFNTSDGDGDYEAKFDIDGNGSVGFTDFLAFARFFGETVPEPVLALTGIAPSEGMPGTLIELLGQFDVNTTYQVKFDTVLLPVFAQNAERISVMVPALSAASVPVRVVDATGIETEPISFEVLGLPEPRMDAAQLRQTVADVGTGIGNVFVPLTRADVIFNDAGAALFNQEMGKLNAAWDVLGQRIEALPPQDAAMLAHLLDNSGALGVLEALGDIDLSASKLAAESTSTHNLLFRVDIVSAIIGYASDLVMVGAIASAVAPEPLFTKAMTGAMGGISTLLGVLKSGIDTTIPTDLQVVSKVVVDPTPVPLGGASDVAFYGTFKTESNLLAELGAEGVGKGMEEIVKLLILKRKGKAFLDELLENETLSNAVDEIVGFFSGVVSDVGFGVTGLENLFENVAIPRYDEPLDMSLYRLSVPSIIKWIIPPFPAEEIDKMVGVLEKVGIDLVSESVEVVNRRDEVDREVAEYDPVTGKLKGYKAGEMRLKMRAFRFVEPGGGSEDGPEEDNRGFWRRVWDRAVNIVKIPLDLIANLHPVFRFSNSLERLPPVYWNINVRVPPPNLIVDLPPVTEGLSTGQFFNLSATVQNAGHGQADATTLRIYLSDDSSVTGNDTQLDSIEVGVLASSDSIAASVTLTAPISVGTYYYGACVDQVPGEINIDDNCSAPVRVIVDAGPTPATRTFNLHDHVSHHLNGVTYINSRFYVVGVAGIGSGEDSKVFVYTGSGARDSNSDFHLEDDILDGITYANNRFYVVGSFWTEKAYAYSSSGRRDPKADFVLDDDNGNPTGITYANNRFYVVDDNGGFGGVIKVYAYTSSGQRDPKADFVLDSDNEYPVGIVYANDRFYVVDDWGKVFVYRSSGQRDSNADFDLDDGNDSPNGITYANNRLYVLQYHWTRGDRKVYVYKLSGE